MCCYCSPFAHLIRPKAWPSRAQQVHQVCKILLHTFGVHTPQDLRRRWKWECHDFEMSYRQEVRGARVEYYGELTAFGRTVYFRASETQRHHPTKRRWGIYHCLN